jgi:hypothetical protein
MGVPPMKQATTVRVPATDRTQSLEEVLGAGLTTLAVSTQCLNAGEKAQHKCEHDFILVHMVYSPVQFLLLFAGCLERCDAGITGRPVVRERAETRAMVPVATPGQVRPAPRPASLG